MPRRCTTSPISLPYTRIFTTLFPLTLADAHSQEFHLHDPPLTDLGIEQCAALRDNLEQRFSSIESDMAIIASPMRRTLQTAQLALPWLIKKGVKVEADANWQGTARP